MKKIEYYNLINRCSSWKQLELNVLCKEQAISINENTSCKINLYI